MLDPFRDTEVASTTLLVFRADQDAAVRGAALYVFVRAWREVAADRT